MDKGFTLEEFTIIQKYKLPLPSSVLMETIKDGDTVIKILDKSGEINKELGREKAHLSTTKTAKKKNNGKIAEYTEEIDAIKNIENE